MLIRLIVTASLDGPLPGLGGRRKASCTLKLTTCFGPWWDDEAATISADDMFKRLAFSDDGSCGDCRSSLSSFPFYPSMSSG